MKNVCQLVLSLFTVLSLGNVSGAPQPQLIAQTSHGHSAQERSELQPELIVQTRHEVTTLSFNVDGALLASGGRDGTIKLWSLAGRAEIRTYTGQHEYITSIAFSPAANLLATASHDKTIAIWDTISGSNKCSWPAYGRERQESYTGIRDWEITPKGEHRVENIDARYPASVVFSRDGQTLLSVGAEGSQKLWDVESCKQVNATANPSDYPRSRKLRNKSESDPTAAVAVSNDGKWIATAEYAADITIRDQGKKTSFKLEGNSGAIDQAVLSPDEKSLLCFAGSRINVWDLEAGVWDKTLTLPFTGKIAVSADRRHVAGAEKDTIYVLNLDSYDLKEIKYPLKNTINAIAVSPDGSTVFVADYQDGGDCSVIRWDVTTGVAKQRWEGIQPYLRTTALAFSPDGKTLVSGGRDKMIRFTSLQGSKPTVFINLEPELTWVGRDTLSIAFNPANPDEVAVGCLDGEIRILDSRKGVITRTLKSHEDAVLALMFSEDGNFLFSGSADKSIKQWDLKNSNETPFPYVGHLNRVTSLTSTRDGKLLISGGADGKVEMWNTKTRRELLSLAVLSEPIVGTTPATARWLVSSPEGRFDTNSIETIATLHWRFRDAPMTPLPLEIFMRQYFEPALLRRTLKSEALPELPPLASLNRARPEVVIRITSKPGAQTFVTGFVDVASVSEEQRVDGKLVSLQSGAFDLRLFRDGQLVSYQSGNLINDPSGKASIPFSVKIPRTKGLENIELTAYAFNSDRVKSETAKHVHILSRPVAPTRGKAYVISVGVNATLDPGWDLSFAASDALLSEKMLTTKLRAAGEYDVVPVTLTSEHGQTGHGRAVTKRLASKRNFQTVLNALAYGPDKVDSALLEEIPNHDLLRKVEPEDLVLISFSSHGYTDKNGKFYLVPYDTDTEIKLTSLGDEIAPESLANFISSDDLSEWVRDIDARELVLIVDTCHSAGAVAEPGFKPGPMGSRGMGQLAYDKGMRVLAASQADDVALEVDRLEQGLLTFVLMREGLERGEADQDGNGLITLDEWLAYALARVPTLYKDLRAGKAQELKAKDVQITSVLIGESQKKNAYQKPQLFDFKRKPVGVVISRTR